MKNKIIVAVTVFVVLIGALFTPGLFDDWERGFITIENEGLKELDSTTTEESDPKYVLNTSSKKYHKPHCMHAQSISKENCYKTSDMEFITSREYKKCSVCFKND